MSEQCALDLQDDQELGPIRYIHREDDDHSLYHQDTFHMDDTHMHLKFKSQLTEKELNHLLQIFQDYQLISPFERNMFLLGNCFRHKLACIEMDRFLGLTSPLAERSQASVEGDTKKIISYLKTIQDNDILLDLHNHLLSASFDYLRENPAGNMSIWQGTDAHGNVIKTSKSWAIIEKTITLQMENNIAAHCQFNRYVAQDRVHQLSRYPFFCVKHNVADSRPQSPSIEAFLNGDRQGFDDTYQHHFNKCS